MPRATRLSGQLPSPPKSFDGSQSSESSEINNNKNKRQSISKPSKAMTPPEDRKSRVLRRQSTQNVSGEIRAFFAVSALPAGKNKQEMLVSAVNRVSQFWDGPPKETPRGARKAQDDSALPTKSQSQEEAAKPMKKRYLTSGLYAGSRTSADNTKILGKPRKSDPGPGAGRKFKFTLPIFHGKHLMDQQRDFKLPWNLYATTGENCKPPNWSRIRRNIHVDVDPYDKKADRPECLCRVECDEACLNRAMFYECDDQNCALDNPADCTNRTFQEAAIRYADHKAKSCGFEVFSTGERGFGLRALRDFQPNAFILEYRGEVISTEECENRMVTIYAGRNNYYFLNIDAYTVLDAGRKGSEARFANHCCDPNGRIEKWIVKGEPRIGLFAGKRGIEAGEEITYGITLESKSDVDYNFSWFEGAKEQKCMCGAENCRGFIGKRKAMPPPVKTDPKTAKTSKGAASKAKGVKRVIQGRITKVTKTKVKAQVKNGKVVKTTIVTARKKVNVVKKPTKAKASTKTKVFMKTKVSTKTKISSPSKKSTLIGRQSKNTTLGKRKRTDTPKKAGTGQSPAKKVAAPRIIAKPVSKAAKKTIKARPENSVPIPNRPIYDTVSHRSRKRNIH